MVNIKCPKCKYSKTKTLWVRHKDNFTMRQRSCPKCDYKFLTKEMVDDGWDRRAIIKSVYETVKECAEGKR